MVAYFFSPVGGVAVARTLGSVRYLPDAGWTPVVIAPAGSTYHLTDPAGLGALPPGLEVERARTIEPGHLRRLLARGGTTTPAPAAEAIASAPVASTTPTPTSATPVPAPRPNAGLTWPARIRRTLWFPDDQLGWIPSAVMAVRRAHARAPLAALHSSSRRPAPTSPPRSRRAGSGSRGSPTSAIRGSRTPSTPRWAGSTPGGAARWRPGSSGRPIAYVRHAEPARRLRPSLPRARRPVLGHRERLRPRRAAAAAGARRRGRRRSPAGLRRLPVPAGRARHVPRRRPRPARPPARGRRSPAGRVHRLGDRRVQGGRGVTARAGRPRVGRDLHAVPPPGRGAPAAGGRRRGPHAPRTRPRHGAVHRAKLYDAIGLDRPVVAMLPPGDAREVLAGLDWGIVCDPEPARSPTPSSGSSTPPPGPSRRSRWPLRSGHAGAAARGPARRAPARRPRTGMPT